jgi:hypothetical protein
MSESTNVSRRAGIRIIAGIRIWGIETTGQCVATIVRASVVVVASIIVGAMGTVIGLGIATIHRTFDSIRTFGDRTGLTRSRHAAFGSIAENSITAPFIRPFVNLAIAVIVNSITDLDATIGRTAATSIQTRSRRILRSKINIDNHSQCCESIIQIRSSTNIGFNRSGTLKDREDHSIDIGVNTDPLLAHLKTCRHTDVCDIQKLSFCL